jgi:penicillin-binding protein 1C
LPRVSPEYGFAGLTEAADFYGYALALGSLDVRLEELVNAYRGLANGGLLAPLRFTPATQRSRAHRVQSPQSAFLVGDILSDRQARSLTFGLENPLATRYWTAVKTGTSKDMRDNWCIGYSRRHTVGVWIGNFNGSPMHDVSGVSGAAPAWAAIMDHLQATGDEAEAALLPPKPPAGLIRQSIRIGSEPERSEWFIPGTEPAADVWKAATPITAITYPVNGMILALDPDIPKSRQQLHFRAGNPPIGATWLLDDVRLESDLWPMTVGKHRLVLIDADAIPLDQIEFEVR